MDSKQVSVIGAGRLESDAQGRSLGEAAEELGRLLAGHGFTVVCGGLAGVMERVCKGARRAGGRTIGILPSWDRADANPWVEIPVATGLGQMRNALVVANGEIVVAVGGGYGTLSEIALAKKSGKTVISIGSWQDIPGVIQVQSPGEAVDMILGKLER